VCAFGKGKSQNQKNQRSEVRSQKSDALPLATFSSGPALLTVSSIGHLLELLPLFCREHGLQAIVGVLAHLAEPGFRFFAQLGQLLSRVFKYFIDLCPLILRKIELIEHLLETDASSGSWRPMPIAIDVHCKPTRNKSNNENDEDR
jgi:hypothetical protein